MDTDYEMVCLADKITKKFNDKVLKEMTQKSTCHDITLQMDLAKIELK